MVLNTSSLVNQEVVIMTTTCVTGDNIMKTLGIGATSNTNNCHTCFHKKGNVISPNDALGRETILVCGAFINKSAMYSCNFTLSVLCLKLHVQLIINVALADWNHWYLVRYVFDIMTWKRFPNYCPCVWGIHRLLVDSLHKGPVMLSFDVCFAFVFVISLDKLLNKRLGYPWSETPWRSYEPSVMNVRRITASVVQEDIH